MTVGWTWTSDGGEEEDLEEGDDGAKEIEVEDGEGLEGAVAEEVVDYAAALVRRYLVEGNDRKIYH